METRQMRYLVAIADHGSLTRAAETLNVAQPALSQALTRLENELGVRLFERSRRGAALTLAGRAIMDDVRASLARAEAAATKARAIGAGRAGRLTIGFVTQAVYVALPRALRAFHAGFPDVDVVLREMSNAEQVAALEEGTIDVGLLHPPVVTARRMHERLVSRDRFIAVLPTSYPLGGDGTVSLADVAEKGLIWFPQSQLPFVYAQILNAFHGAGLELPFIREANRSLTVLACVAADLGASLLPESVRALRHQGVQYAEVRDNGKLPYFDLSAVWAVRSRKSFADSFAATLTDAPVREPAR